MTEKFNYRKIQKPVELSNDSWNLLSLYHREIFSREFSHTPQVFATPCHGGFKGATRNHVYIVKGREWVWSTEKYQAGSWVDSCIELTGWMQKEQLPETINFLGEERKVIASGSHTICPECSIALKEQVARSHSQE